jgi:hypothetical protein
MRPMLAAAPRTINVMCHAMRHPFLTMHTQRQRLVMKTQGVRCRTILEFFGQSWNNNNKEALLTALFLVRCSAASRACTLRMPCLPSC